MAERTPAWQRALDVAVGAPLLVASIPLIAVLGAWIRFDSTGPALFRQRRIGLAGRPFDVWKLRTMRVRVGDDLHREHTRRLMGPASDSAPWAPPAEDPRVTRPGRTLRRLGLDELPQLWNVMRGEMSLVGPRPALPYEVERWLPEHRRRLAVRPGLTGFWQVEARRSATFDEMMRMDLAYVERQGLLLDLVILARTPMALVRAVRS